MTAPSYRRLLAIVAACLTALTTFAVSTSPAAATSSTGGAHAKTSGAPKPSRATHPAPSISWYIDLSSNPYTVNGNSIFVVNPYLTATANNDVGPTPYYIQIWDLTDGGTQVAQCSSGTSCSAYYGGFVGSATKVFVETIALPATSYPPPGIQAISHVIYITRNATAGPYYTAGLNIAQSTIAPYPFILTATSSADVGPTPYYIDIFDVTTGIYVGSCGSGTTCGPFDYVTGENDGFVAFIALGGTSLPPPGIVANSWTAW